MQNAYEKCSYVNFYSKFIVDFLLYGLYLNLVLEIEIYSKNIIGELIFLLSF